MFLMDVGSPTPIRQHPIHASTQTRTMTLELFRQTEHFLPAQIRIISVLDAHSMHLSTTQTFVFSKELPGGLFIRHW
jgi:hypothetical protein